MLSFIVAIIGVVVTILLVIGVHEFGHFIVARWCGIKVVRFSLGFGKVLLKFNDKRGTEYALSAIPLGGYIKMIDESEGDVAPEDLPYAFNRQPIYKRIAVIAAGPLFNFIFAFLIYWFLFVVGFTTIKPIIGNIAPHSIADDAGLKPKQEILEIDNHPVTSWYGALLKIMQRTGDTGSMQITTKPLNNDKVEVHTLALSNWHIDELKPDPLKSFGIMPYEPEIPAIIGVIQTNSPANRAGLLSMDKIISVDGAPVKDWTALVAVITKSQGKTVSLQVMRNDKLIILPVLVGTQKKQGFLGIGPHYIFPDDLLRHNQYNVLDAIPHAMYQTQDFIDLNLIVIGKMLTGKISVKSLGGPITIFESAGSALNQGFVPFLSFLAFLSISIGIINIIPIPGLDGGHILFQMIEFIMRRPISERTQVLCFRLGLIMLLLLMTQAIINDFMRL